MLPLLFTSVVAQEMSPKHFWHTLTTEASPETIWNIWTDVEHWQDWDTGLQSARLDGPFELGQTGELISDKGRKVKFSISEFEAGKSYAFTMKLPLGRFTVRRTLGMETGKTAFTHDVRFSGFSGGFFGRVLGKDYMKQLPGALENIREIAEGSNTSLSRG